MVIGGLITPPNVPGAYGVFLPAKSVIEGKQRTTDGKTVDETWQLTGEDGSAIEVELHMCAVHRARQGRGPGVFGRQAGLQRQLEFAAERNDRFVRRETGVVGCIPPGSRKYTDRK
jgi:hypothetical protein